MKFDNLIIETGESVYVEEVRVEKLAESVTVYNLEVEDLHVYYVAGVLVHNTCGRDDFYKDEAEDSVDDFISLHSYNRHRYNADIKSTAKKTQYGKNINVRKLCEDTFNINNSDSTYSNYSEYVSKNGNKINLSGKDLSGEPSQILLNNLYCLFFGFFAIIYLKFFAGCFRGMTLSIIIR